MSVNSRLDALLEATVREVVTILVEYRQRPVPGSIDKMRSVIRKALQTAKLIGQLHPDDPAKPHVAPSVAYPDRSVYDTIPGFKSTRPPPKK